MIGRTREQAVLRDHLTATPTAPPLVVLVDGPMGSGKTALVTSVAAEVDTPLLLTRADRFMGASPLATARPLIEDLLADDLDEVVAAHSERWILRACAAALHASPSVVVVDDAQWTDPVSTRLLAELVSSAAPLTVVLAYRTAMAPTQLVDAARGAGARIEHVSLEPLGDGDIARIAEGVTPEQMRIIVEAATGNPLFARTLRAAFLRHREATTLHEALPLKPYSSSESLRSVVSADVRALPERTRRTLEAIAVLGGCDPDQLRRLTGAPVDDHLAVLRWHGLLSDTPAEPLHPVVRSSAYQATADTDLTRLHRRASTLPGMSPFDVAEHLSRLRTSLTAADLPRLLDAAEHGLATDPPSVERWLQATAHLADQRRDLLLARALVVGGQAESATALLRTLVESSPHDSHARALLAHALRMSGRPDEAHDVLSAHGIPRDPVLLLELTATASQIDGHQPDGRLLAELSTVRHEPFRSAAAALRTIALLNTGEIARARREFRDVAGTIMATPPEDLCEVLDAVVAAAWCAYMLDDFAMSVDLAERGLRVARRAGRVNAQPGLYCALAYALVQHGRLEEADAAADLSIEAAERYRVPDIVAMARNAHVLSAFWQHDDDLMRSRLDVLRATPLPAVRWWRRTVESTLARTSAMLGDAVHHVLVADPPDVMTPLRYADAGTIALFGGDVATARRHFESGRRLALDYGLASQSAFLGTLLAMVLAGEGATAAARAIELLEEARETHERLGMPCHLEMTLTNLRGLQSSASAKALDLLTRREVEVADLLAAGKTNQEIADALVISRRTAEEHVGNVLRKLGLSSRHGVLQALRG